MRRLDLIRGSHCDNPVINNDDPIGQGQGPRQYMPFKEHEGQCDQSGRTDLHDKRISINVKFLPRSTPISPCLPTEAVIAIRGSIGMSHD